MKRLVQYLEEIGQEIHDTAYVDADGALRPITKDEQLAREIWRRALGYEKEVKSSDGTATHRIFEPDAKAQQFIFERREGKYTIPQEDTSMPLLERISEIAKINLNKIAEQSVDDRSIDNNPVA